MKASELVKELQELIRHHGDLPVFATVDWAEIGSIYFETALDPQPDCFMLGATDPCVAPT